MIGLALKKTADQQSEKEGTRKPLPAKSASELYHNYLYETWVSWYPLCFFGIWSDTSFLLKLSNNVLRECQHNDGRDEVEVIQDVVSTTALNVFSNQEVTSSLAIQRSLQQHMPRQKVVAFHGSDRGTTSLTYAQAHAERSKLIVSGLKGPFAGRHTSRLWSVPGWIDKSYCIVLFVWLFMITCCCLISFQHNLIHLITNHYKL